MVWRGGEGDEVQWARGIPWYSCTWLAIRLAADWLGVMPRDLERRSEMGAWEGERGRRGAGVGWVGVG